MTKFEIVTCKPRKFNALVRPQIVSLICIHQRQMSSSYKNKSCSCHTTKTVALILEASIYDRVLFNLIGQLDCYPNSEMEMIVFKLMTEDVNT